MSVSVIALLNFFIIVSGLSRTYTQPLTFSSLLLILLDGEKITLKEEEAITLPLYELELKTGISISPMVMLKKLWENRPFKTPFYINVTNEGIVL